MSDERVFLDTNIIVYAYDKDAGKKHEVARELLFGLWNSEGGILSSQILQEFCVTVTRKIELPLPVETTREIVEDFLSWDVVANDGDTILQAIKIQIKEKISFWDALVVAAAQKGGADILLTEDLSDGRRFGNLTVRNPFAPSGA